MGSEKDVFRISSHSLEHEANTGTNRQRGLGGSRGRTNDTEKERAKRVSPVKRAGVRRPVPHDTEQEGDWGGVGRGRVVWEEVCTGLLSILTGIS